MIRRDINFPVKRFANNELNMFAIRVALGQLTPIFHRQASLVLELPAEMARKFL